MDLCKYGRMIWRRRWYLLTMIVLVVSLVAIKTPRLTPIYRAAATVMPSQSLLNRAAGEDATTARDRRMANLLELGRSREVCARAIADLGLPLSPERLREMTEIKPLLVQPFSTSGTSDTDIIEVSVRYQDPDKVPAIANAVARNFVKYYDEFSGLEADASRRKLAEQASEARRRLAAAERELDAFRRGRGASLPDARNAMLQQYGNLVAMKEDAGVGAGETAARLGVVRRQLTGQPEVRISEQGTTNNPTVQSLEARLTELELRLAAEASVHTSEHPNIVALRSEIAQVRSKLSGVVRKIFSHETMAANPLRDKLMNDVLEAEVASIAARARLVGANGAVGRIEGRLNGVSAAETKYASLIREVRLADEAYTAVANRYNDFVAGGAVSQGGRGSIKMVDAATIAEGPVNKSFNLPVAIAFGVFGSLFIGILLILGMDYLDGTVRGTEEVRNALQKPLLGEIPRMGPSGAVSGLPILYQDHAIDISPFGEAYRLLRTAFIFRCRQDDIRAAAIFSPQPHEGRTTIAINLATSLALSGQKVLLIDADLREPVLHRIFSVANDKGLSSILSKKDVLADGIRKTAVDNLFLLPSGPLPANPSELLGSVEMGRLMEELRHQEAFLLFDTSASLAFTDASLLSALTDGVIHIVGAGRSSLDDHRLALEQLEMVGAKVVGIVVNGVEPEEMRSYNAYKQHIIKPINLANLKKKAIISAGSVMAISLLSYASFIAWPHASKTLHLGAEGIASGCRTAFVSCSKAGSFALSTLAERHDRLSSSAQAKVAPDVEVSAKESYLHPVDASVSRIKDEEVCLSATGRCWVTASINGRKDFSGFLKPGERRRWDAEKGKVVLRIGDASQVRLSYGGKALSLDPEADRTAEVVFSPGASRQRQK